MLMELKIYVFKKCMNHHRLVHQFDMQHVCMQNLPRTKCDQKVCARSVQVVKWDHQGFSRTFESRTMMGSGLSQTPVSILKGISCQWYLGESLFLIETRQIESGLKVSWQLCNLELTDMISIYSVCLSGLAFCYAYRLMLENNVFKGLFLMPLNILANK